MLIKCDKSKIYVKHNLDQDRIPILFLHGFTGSSNSWDAIFEKIYHPTIAIDIPGHGRSLFNDIKCDYTYKDFRNELYLSLSKLNIKKLHICAYSMGSRLAVSFAQKFPKMIKSLIIESGSLGIVDSMKKDERLSQDIKTAERIINSYDDFIDDWKKNPLFEKQKERSPVQYKIQNDIRKSHSAQHLAKSLISFSKGTMPAFEEAFSLFKFPIYFINGEDDTKYIKVARDMMKINKKSIQYIVEKANHNINIENNEMYLTILNKILNEFS